MSFARKEGKWEDEDVRWRVGEVEDVKDGLDSVRVEGKERR